MAVICHINYLLFNLLLFNYRLHDNRLCGEMKELAQFCVRFCVFVQSLWWACGKLR